MYFRRLILLLVCASAGTRLLAETAAVLPFANRTAAADPSQASLDWIGESIAETIRESLVAQGVLALDREDRQEGMQRLSVRPYALLTLASVVKIAEALLAREEAYDRAAAALVRKRAAE